MSDETTQADTASSDRATLAQLLMGVVTADAAETDTQDTSQDAETPVETAEDATTAPAAEAPTEPTYAAEGDEGTPQWENQAAAGKAFAALNQRVKAAEQAARDAELKAAHLAGLAEGRAAQAPATPAKPVDPFPKPSPDAFQSDEAYFDALLDWTAQKAARDAEAKAEAKYGGTLAEIKEQMAAQAWSASMSRAQVAAGDSWAAVVAYANQMQAVSPGFAADLNSAADPGKFALDAYNLATGQSTTPAVAKAPPAATKVNPTAPAPKAGADSFEALMADPANRERALRLLAAEKAARGDTPQIPTGPRGIGSSPGAQGAAEGLTVEAVRGMNNPQKLAETRGQLFGAWITGLADSDD